MSQDYTPRAAPPDQLAAFLVSMFNICLRPQRKVMSAALVDRLHTLIRDAVADGDPIYDLLDDLLSQPPQPIRSERITQQFERPAYGDAQFEAWRRQREEDAR